MLESGSKVWEYICEFSDQPLAIVGLDNTFVWVNSAWEKLVGYSTIELLNMTWMDITISKDKAGNAESVSKVRDGFITNYSMSKNYRHKNGQQVPVVLTVTRFPSDKEEPIVAFLVKIGETLPLEDINTLIENIEKRLEKMENDKEGINITIGQLGDGHNAGGDIVGKDKNSDNAIKFIVGAAVVMFIFAAWVIYYLSSIINPNPVEPPNFKSTPEVESVSLELPIGIGG